MKFCTLPLKALSHCGLNSESYDPDHNPESYLTIFCTLPLKVLPHRNFEL